MHVINFEAGGGRAFQTVCHTMYLPISESEHRFRQSAMYRVVCKWGQKHWDGTIMYRITFNFDSLLIEFELQCNVILCY